MNNDCINRSGVLIYFAWRNCSHGLICKAIKRVARQVKQIVFAQFLQKKNVTSDMEVELTMNKQIYYLKDNDV